MGEVNPNQRELDAILTDMAGAGAEPRRAAKRIRRLVDCLLLAEITSRRPFPLPTKLHVDVPTVSGALAVVLVEHHLALAAAYYEAADEDEVGRYLAQERGANAAVAALSLDADRAWLREMDRAYREMDAGGEES